MMNKQRIILLLLLCQCQYIFTQSNAWKTTDWNIKCQIITNSANGDYYSGEGIMSDPCTYTKRADQSEYVVLEAEKEAIKSDLIAASQLLSSYGYKEPLLKGTNSYWIAKIFPGDCWCTVSNCCNTFSDPNTLGIFSRNATGGVVAGKGELFVKAMDVVQDAERSITAVHELYHAVMANYTIASSSNTDLDCIPFCWIGEGGAEAFGYFWAKQQGLSAHGGYDRKYDISLYSNDYLIGQNTAEFWEFIADQNQSFEFMRHIYDQGFSGDQGAVGHGVAAVDEGLKMAGIDGGLYSSFKKFVPKVKQEDYYSQIPEETINKDEKDFYIDLGDIEPIAIKAGKAKIESGELDLENNKQRRVDLVISFDEGVDKDDLHLFVDGKDVGKEFREDITERCREEKNFESWIQVANINKDPKNSEKQGAVKMKLRLEIMECPLLPEGFSRMVYENTDPKGEKISRMTYYLDVDENNEQGQEGNMFMRLYSFALERDLAVTSLDFECTKEGVVLQGTEIGYIPGLGADFSYLEMSISQNTNIIPHKPKPGESLKDADVVVNAEANSAVAGLFGMDFHTKIRNRKVVAKETITVEAGSFECYRIEFTSSSTISFSGAAIFLNLIKRRLERASKSSSIIWVSEGHGWIKQEITNNEGTSIFELVSLTKAP